MGKRRAHDSEAREIGVTAGSERDLARKVIWVSLLPFFFTTLRMPAMLLLLLWFAVQLISDLAAHDGGASIAFRAHIGGFVTGAVLIKLFENRERVWERDSLREAGRGRARR